MFELRIETAPEALRLMQEGWPTRIVSLVGDDLRFDLPRFGSKHLIARFHDVETVLPGFTAPSRDVLEAALNHARDLGDDDRLLVHCHAGKSRSPAMAIGILVSAGLSATEAMDRVKQLRPFVIPNRLMIGILDEILGQGGRLVRVVKDHYKSLPEEAALPDRGRWNL